MSREIKFKYTFKVITVNGEELNEVVLSLEDIQKRVFTGRKKDLIAVSQYTGLKDKNGKEIYEGDKIIITTLIADEQDHGGVFGVEFLGWSISKEEFTVSFVDGMFTLDKEITCPLSHYFIQAEDYEIEDFTTVDNEGMDSNEALNKVLGIEIIGNIHQNKELIK